jgi:hypothetical protein
MCLVYRLLLRTTAHHRTDNLPLAPPVNSHRRVAPPLRIRSCRRQGTPVARHSRNKQLHLLHVIHFSLKNYKILQRYRVPGCAIITSCPSPEISTQTNMSRKPHASPKKLCLVPRKLSAWLHRHEACLVSPPIIALISVIVVVSAPSVIAPSVVTLISVVSPAITSALAVIRVVIPIPVSLLFLLPFPVVPMVRRFFCTNAAYNGSGNRCNGIVLFSFSRSVAGKAAYQSTADRRQQPALHVGRAIPLARVRPTTS